MTERKFLIPRFGPFAGIRVIGAGSLIAMPFAASMLAEFGAEVIQIERPSVGDTYRKFASLAQNEKGQEAGAAWIQEARNRLSMTLELNLNDDDAREIFYDLIKQSDVFMESLVWTEKLGIRDEKLLEINPKLVIAHVSGFGRQEFGGIPEICDQASYDMIGQAFSGYAMLNGDCDQPPMLTKPALNDYTTSLFALFGVLAAYINAQNTGRGQVVDISQFESQAKIMRAAFIVHSLGLGAIPRSGNKSMSSQPWDVLLSKDGKYMCIGAVGKSVFTRFVEAIGEDIERYPYEKVGTTKAAIESKMGREFFDVINEWFAQHNADEIEQIMRRFKVPCSRVNTPEDCLENAHYAARNDFVTYTDQTLGKAVKAFGVFPKFSNTPGMIWRGAPTLGQDTDAILSRLLDYDQQKIHCLHEKGII